MYPIITKLGGRRFIMAMAGIVISTAVLVGKLIDMDTYQYLMIAFAVIYTGGNTTQKVTTIKAGK